MFTVLKVKQNQQYREHITFIHQRDTFKWTQADWGGCGSDWWHLRYVSFLTLSWILAGKLVWGYKAVQLIFFSFFFSKYFLFWDFFFPFVYEQVQILNASKSFLSLPEHKEALGIAQILHNITLSFAEEEKQQQQLSGSKPAVVLPEEHRQREGTGSWTVPVAFLWPKWQVSGAGIGFHWAH